MFCLQRNDRIDSRWPERFTNVQLWNACLYNLKLLLTDIMVKGLFAVRDIFAFTLLYSGHPATSSTRLTGSLHKGSHVSGRGQAKSNKNIFLKNQQQQQED